MLPTMGEKGAKDFQNSYLTCHMLPEEVESCDFETLNIEIGHRQHKKAFILVLDHGGFILRQHFPQYCT